MKLYNIFAKLDDDGYRKLISKMLLSINECSMLSHV